MEESFQMIKPEFVDSLKIRDRSMSYNYDFRMTDESFLAALKMMRWWKKENPGPYTKQQEAVFNLFESLPHPKAAEIALSARKNSEEGFYVCPTCGYTTLTIDREKGIGECETCSIGVLLEDSIRIEPGQTVEGAVNRIVEAPK